jgi:hypothetical protein
MQTYKEVWRTEKNRQINFWVEGEQKCVVCEGLITGGPAIHVVDWNRKGFFEESFTHPQCLCGFKKNPLSIVPERKIVFVIEQRPIGSVLVVPQPPSVICRNRGEMSLAMFDLVSKSSERVVDRTIHSHADSFEGAVIGCDPSLLLDVKDRMMSVDEAVDYLADLRDLSVRAIVDDKKKLLGGI